MTIKKGSASGSLELQTLDDFSPSALSLENRANLVIESGKIIANASISPSAAGIGFPRGGTCGNITINGGTIIAEGKAGTYSPYYSYDLAGAGIGTGGTISGTGYGAININGAATVTAKGGFKNGKIWAYDIGPGSYWDGSIFCNTVTIDLLDKIVTSERNKILYQKVTIDHSNYEEYFPSL